SGRVRVAWVLIDGIADVSIPELGRQTPLQHVPTPAFDAVASAGVSGLMDPVQAGLACGSDTAHLSMFGYDPRRYYRGRGAFESMGAGLDMAVGDIAFKCNFAILNRATGIVESRRADRRFEEAGPVLCAALNGLRIPGFPEHAVAVQYAHEHRCGVRVRGPGLTDAAESRETALLINAVSLAFTNALEAHPTNLARIAQGKASANCVLLRGCGARISVPAFAERHGWRGFMIAPTHIIRGIGISIGLDVVEAPGATGEYDSDLNSK
ncbi:2,3-bisphosphoglycerate-independent phosphoglycerate mutase-domain-containing protein, partial [Baffinella frigidus]